MGLGSSVKNKAQVYDAQTLDGNTLYTKGHGAGYAVTDEGKSITYYADQNYSTFTLEGFAANATGDDFVVKNGTLYATIDALDKTQTLQLMGSSDDVKDYVLGLGSSVKKAGELSSESKGFENNTYTIADTAGYKLSADSKSITYNESATTKLELSGVASAPVSSSKKVVTLGVDNFSTNLKISTNTDKYTFSVSAGDFTGKTFTGSADDDTIRNDGENLTIKTGRGNDSIVSSGLKVTIDGGNGNDFIKATGEGSSVNGGADDDTIVGGNGADILLGGKGNDSLNGGKGNDRIDGGADDDTILGGAGNDVLRGSAGNDSLWGGAGDDTLYGGAGADTFVYKPNEGKDTISDYSYEDGDMLQILNVEGDGFGNTSFKNGTFTLAITGGGKVAFNNITASDQFNINGQTYNISGSKLVKA